MSNKSRINLLNTLTKTLSKYETLPPVIENLLNILEKETENGKILQKIDRYVELNTPQKGVNPLQKGGNSDMDEKELNKNEFVKSDFDLQAFNRHESFSRRLDCVYQDKLVVVEFSCGKFLKKAKGCLNLIGCDFIELVRSRNNPVMIEIFSKLGVIERENADRMIIKFDRICAVELDEVCPPCPSRDV